MRIGDAWDRFWFAPQETSTPALFRIAFGLVVTLWTLSLAPDLAAFFGPEGVAPEPPSFDHPGAWGLLALGPGVPVVVALWAVTLLGGIALTLGYRTRIAAWVVFLGVLSFTRRSPDIVNSGDGLLRILALYCALAPAGAALSLDRLRTAPGRFWEFPARAPWALRLVQIQLSVLYLSSVWQKMQGEMWRDGTAVSYALRLEDIVRFPVPGGVSDSVIVSEVLTYGTLALELSIAVLVWNRKLRPWVLGLGVSLHLALDASFVIGYFSLTVLAAYLAFLPPETATRWLRGLRDRFRRHPDGAVPTAPDEDGHVRELTAR